MTDNNLDLPFDHHFCPAAPGQRGAALVFTTEPAECNPQDRQQLDVLAVLEADNGDRYGDRASDLARFVTAALNAYVATPTGRAHWKAVHPHMAEMRRCGRQ